MKNCFFFLKIMNMHSVFVKFKKHKIYNLSYLKVVIHQSLLLLL